MFNILFLIVFFSILINTLVLSAFASNVKMPTFVKKHPSFKSLASVIKNGLEFPVLLDGKPSLTQEVLEQITNLEGKEYILIPYDEFVLSVPHLKNSGAVIYVPDFLIRHGRIFNEYETMFMKTLSGNPNTIVLGSENVDKIPFKDVEMNKYFNVIKMPDICRKHIVLHVQNMIVQNGYDEYLITLPWKDAPLENLTFELINMLLFELSTIRAEYSSALFTLDTLVSNINNLKDLRKILNNEINYLKY